jgi:hypothetical protein
MTIANPFSACDQGNAAGKALGLGDNILDVEPLRSALFSHFNSRRWLDEWRWDNPGFADLPPPQSPDDNPFIQIEITRREALQRQTRETDLEVDRLLEALDALWAALRDHAKAPIWKRGLAAYEQAQVRAERAEPGSVAGIDPQFTGGAA